MDELILSDTGFVSAKLQSDETKDSLKRNYYQQNHGFKIGDVLAFVGGNLAKAKDDKSSLNRVFGIVSFIPHPDEVEITHSGYFYAPSGISGFSAGDRGYLHPISAGGLIEYTTPPTSGCIKVIDFISDFEGIVSVDTIGGSGGGGGGESNIIFVNQPNHGLSFRNAVYLNLNNGKYEKCNANDPKMNDCYGIVTQVVDASGFMMCTGGMLPSNIAASNGNILYLYGGPSYSWGSVDSPWQGSTVPKIPIVYPTKYNGYNYDGLYFVSHAKPILGNPFGVDSTNFGFVAVTDTSGCLSSQSNVNCGNPIRSGSMTVHAGGAVPPAISNKVFVNGGSVQIFDITKSTTQPMITLNLSDIPSGVTSSNPIKLREMTICEGTTTRKICLLCTASYT